MKSASARSLTRSRVALLAMMALAAIGTVGCSGGSDGNNGANGAPGATGATGPTGPTGPGLDPIAAAKPEGCLTCHSDQGVDHQNVYRDYQDAKTKSKFRMDLTSLTAVANATTPVTYTVTLNFNVQKKDANGVNFIAYDDAGLATLDQKRFTVQGYFAGNQYPTQQAFTTSLGTITSLGGGNYTAKNASVAYDPTTLAGWQAYGYIAESALETEGITLYADVADDGLAFGTASTYVSNASVEGCEACHGSPYLKHGYRAAVVAGLPDFSACKECHVDNQAGGHFDWQFMADEPLAWATGGTADATKYAYKRSVMQDTHQTHAMEFPYPMSMANCKTCHATQAKIDAITADSFFKAETCKSCHPVNGTDTWDGQKYSQAGRAPALASLWAETNTTFHNITDDCTICHKPGGPGSQFKVYHSGYSKQIYDASHQRYADLAANNVSIDSVTLTGDVLDVKFSAGNTAIDPYLTISFYGYDAKNMLVSSHTRDAGEPTCYNDRAADPLTAPKVGCRYEIKLDGNTVPTVQTNRLFTVMPDSVPGAWHLQADLAGYTQPASTGLASIPALITSGKTKKAEVVVMPILETSDGVNAALNAATKTFDLVGNAFVTDYFQGTKAVVEAAKCNKCHDALGTTFHSGLGEFGGGVGGNVTVCRTCHVTTSGGAHLEMQSRGIDSYAHSIHKFQAFDIANIDFQDPVFAKRYTLHIEHGFPNFTIKNCEACHVTSSSSVAVTYNPADNTTSLPGLESASAKLTHGWVDLATGAPTAGPRNIGAVPALVTGPASRACGGCHKGVLINEDDEASLAAFQSHMAMGGYNVENDSAGAYVYKMIDKIMTYFK